MILKTKGNLQEEYLIKIVQSHKNKYVNSPHKNLETGIYIFHDREVRKPLSLIFTFLLIQLFASQGTLAKNSFDWTAFSSQGEQAEYISEQLKRWNNQTADLRTKPLRVIYFHAKDREPLKNHLERWDGILSDIKNFFHTEMKKLGYGEVTISLEKENGKLKLHEFRGKEKDESYSYKSGSKIRGEVFEALRAKGLDPDGETLLIVCGLSKTEDKKVTIYSPYYGMGADHNRGICFTADMEWLSIDGLKPDPQKITLQVKEHRGYEPFTLNRFNTVYIGGTIHELGHGLSLPHNLATKREEISGTALMGAGNYTYRKEWRNQGKGSFLTHSSALRLLVHPLFNGDSNQSKENPALTFKELTIEHNQESILIRGKIDAIIPALAMIAYNDKENKGQRGYMVNNNYDATSWTSVISPKNEFKIRIMDLRDGNHQIRLTSVHPNGATTTKRMHYSRKDGVFDFSKAQQEIKNILAK